MQDDRAPAQARVLSIIASSQTPPRMAELAVRSVSGPRPLTPQVDAMQQAELVSHRIDPAQPPLPLPNLIDHSVVLKSLRAERMLAAEELFTALTHKQRTTLLELLETIAPSDRGQARLAGAGVRPMRRSAA
jgi:hypothetical protein